jgi:gamma-glutamyltranspeptidase/glutathione hydrolase
MAVAERHGVEVGKVSVQTAICPSSRPDVTGTHYAVSAGHPLAALAAVRILEAGGNAVDAGVAGGICLAVVHPDIVNFAGVAPAMIYSATEKRVATIAGVGHWPRLATVEFFLRRCNGEIPDGILRTIVPAAPDAWITALEQFGTLGFAEVAAPAIELARDGFPLSAFVAGMIGRYEQAYRRWPTSAPVYLPGNRAPIAGQRFCLPKLAQTLAFLADEDRSRRKAGRVAGLAAVRQAFYQGDIADIILRFHREEGGLLRREDLEGFRVDVEPALRAAYQGYAVLTCGFWCQGPVLLQVLGILGSTNIASLGHNSPEYIHLLTEAMKLAYADRERYYGDPRHVKVPDGLLSQEYGMLRRGLINMERAWPEMPPAGDPSTRSPLGTPSHTLDASLFGGLPAQKDTSYIAVVDRAGNAFSATPSDVSIDTPLIPELGFPISSRGSQSWLDPSHPSAVAPGKRPRLTPSPAMVFEGDRLTMVFGSPGRDVQPQALLQAFLNVFCFGVSPQQGVELPRFETKSFPDSFWPHEYFPGRLVLEQPMSEDVATALADRGHKVERYGALDWRAGGACLIKLDHTGVLWGAADPRRDSYAVAW